MQAIDEAMKAIDKHMAWRQEDLPCGYAARAILARQREVIQQQLELVAKAARREGFSALSTNTECRFCCGLHGGTPGKEAVIGDTVVCDYCEALVNDILRSLGHMAEEAT